MFVDGESVTLFDFDECGTGWFAHDLAIFQLSTKGMDSTGEWLKPFFEDYAENQAMQPCNRNDQCLMEVAPR